MLKDPKAPWFFSPNWALAMSLGVYAQAGLLIVALSHVSESIHGVSILIHGMLALIHAACYHPRSAAEWGMLLRGRGKSAGTVLGPVAPASPPGTPIRSMDGGWTVDGRSMDGRWTVPEPLRLDQAATARFGRNTRGIRMRATHLCAAPPVGANRLVSRHGLPPMNLLFPEKQPTLI